MDAILEPLFAILSVFVPLGLAYVIVLLQSRKSRHACENAYSNRQDHLMRKGKKFPRVNESDAG
jgi:hypothetical protein